MTYLNPKFDDLVIFTPPVWEPIYKETVRETGIEPDEILIAYLRAKTATPDGWF
jgi:hypothetical protein